MNRDMKIALWTLLGLFGLIILASLISIKTVSIKLDLPPAAAR